MQNKDYIKKQLNNCGINYLYYMAPVENVPSIIDVGIQSRNRAKNLPHRDVSSRAVQRRRDDIVEISGRSIHDYAPLYFATHTPMQYVIIHGSSPKYPKLAQEELIFIVLDPVKIFSTTNVIFTDGNAASDATSFFDDTADLDKLNRKILACKKCFTPEYKRKKCAEVLVPDKVSISKISKIVVYSKGAETELKKRIRRYANKKYAKNSVYKDRYLKRASISIDKSYYF